MLLTYMPTYAHQELGFSQDTANFATSVTLVCYIVSISLMGHMSDSFGRRRMLISACIAFIVVSIPLFVVMTKATTLMVVILCQIVFAIVLTANDGTLATFLAESFPTNVRLRICPVIQWRQRASWGHDTICSHLAYQSVRLLPRTSGLSHCDRTHCHGGDLPVPHDSRVRAD